MVDAPPSTARAVRAHILLAGWLWIIAASPSFAQETSAAASLRPDRWFVQFGVAEKTRAYTAGLIWEWRWGQHRAHEPGGRWSGYTEVALSHWRNEPSVRVSNAVFSRFGVTPVVRYWFDGASGWFVEAGIGLNVIAPHFNAGEQRFSTTFNFGDHLGLGWRRAAVGPQQSGWEWSLRFQHFSNAGIRSPNPGADFVQLRLSMPW